MASCRNCVRDGETSGTMAAQQNSTPRQVRKLSEAPTKGFAFLMLKSG